MRDLDARLRQQRVRGAIENQQLLERRGAQAVDEHGDAPAAGLAVGEQSLHHGLCNLVRRRHGAALDPGLAVDAHAELHLPFLDREPRGGRAGNEARRQRDADRARAIRGVLRDALHLVHRRTAVGRRTRGLEREDHPRHAAALGALRGGGARDIVGDDDGGGLAALVLEVLAGLREAHAVATVVAEHAHHARAAVRRPDGLAADVERGSSEHFADRARGQHPGADVPREHGQVTEAAAGDHADLALARSCGACDHAAALPVARKREAHAFQRLVDVVRADR